jgi:hypothetical protein
MPRSRFREKGDYLMDDDVDPESASVLVLKV